jgi:hypothetical protein
MGRPLIYADFMKVSKSGRLKLVCLGTVRDMSKHGLEFSEGMKLTFYNEDEDSNGNSDDLVVEGIVEFDGSDDCWIARIDWDEIKNISKLSPTERERLGIQ